MNGSNGNDHHGGGHGGGGSGPGNGNGNNTVTIVVDGSPHEVNKRSPTPTTEEPDRGLFECRAGIDLHKREP